MTFKHNRFEGKLQKPINLPYLIYKPNSAPPEAGYPLILALHGAGQRGTDLTLVENHGLPIYIASNQDFPYLVCAPQCPDGDTWLLYLDELLALIDEITGQFPIDSDRIIICGQSMGGNGVWNLACKEPHRFAAAVPICGWGDWIMDFPDRVHQMKSVPTWAFHGEDDDVIPLEESQKMVSALRKAGCDVQLTIYPGVAHESWDLAYQDKALFEWLDTKKRQQ